MSRKVTVQMDSFSDAELIEIAAKEIGFKSISISSDRNTVKISNTISFQRKNSRSSEISNLLSGSKPVQNTEPYSLQCDSHWEYSTMSDPILDKFSNMDHFKREIKLAYTAAETKRKLETNNIRFTLERQTSEVDQKVTSRYRIRVLN